MYLPLIVADKSRPDYVGTVDVDPSSSHLQPGAPITCSITAACMHAACCRACAPLNATPKPARHGHMQEGGVMMGRMHACNLAYG